MQRFPNLFRTITLGPITVRNRIVFSAHLTNFAQNGNVSDQHVAYYKERALGGVGLIITEEHSTHESDWPYEKMIHGFRPEVVNGYIAITEAVHQAGSRIFAQINHNGAQGTSNYSRLPLFGPSPKMDPMFREVPKEVTESDIVDIISGYVKVAEHARLGGFDGIELQCSHSSIVRQFLSPITNERTDRWGGSIENRARLMVALIEATRKAIGPNMALGVRICGDEMVEGGLEIEDAVKVAQIANGTSMVDYINTSIGIATQSLYSIEASMAIPPGYSLFIPAAIRQVVDIPVVAVGRFKDPSHCERAIRDGQADLVGVVRGQIADPNFAKKAKEGLEHEIRTCLSCNQECVGRMGVNRWLGCIENPDAGKEAARNSTVNSGGSLGIGIGAFGAPKQRSVRVAGTPRRVAVVGAGPAGLQAAISSARQGHLVALFEANAEVGGALTLASKAPHRAELADLIRNQLSELGRMGVSPNTNHTITLDEILNLTPDAIVIATGSVPDPPWWSTGHLLDNELSRPKVTNPVTVLNGLDRPTGRVVVYDDLGFHQATSVAELLAERGCQVVVVTPHLSVGTDLGLTLDLETWQLRNSRNSVRQEVECVAVGMTETSILLQRHTTGETLTIEADWIVAVNHGRSENTLYRNLRHVGWSEGLFLIGDAVAPRRAHSAVIEGDLVGALIP